MSNSVTLGVISAFSSSNEKIRIKFISGFITTFKRNIKIISQYKLNLINSLFDSLITYTLYFFSSLIIPNRIIDTPYYTISSLAYLFSGAFVVYFITSSMSSGLYSIIREIQQGTFESLFISEFGLKRYIYAEILFELIYTLAKNMLFMIPAIVIFGLSHSTFKINSSLTFALTILLTLTFAFGLTLLASIFTILMKRGKEISMIFSAIILFLSGTLYPLSVFPKWLEIIANISPITQIISLIRYILFTQYTLADAIIWHSLAYLFIWVILLFGVFLLLFRFMIKKEKQKGSFNFY